MATVLTQNETNGPMVLVHGSGDSRLKIAWKGKGDPHGEDLQEVPEDVVKTVRFRTALARGQVSVHGDQEAEAAIERQAAAWRESQNTQGVDRAIVRDSNKDYVTMPCVGPAARGNGTCDVPVPVRLDRQEEQPPLCGTHEGLKPRFQCVKDEADKVTWVAKPKSNAGNPPRTV